MNRRHFIASLLTAATLDPERLLWIPGRKTIFVPPPVKQLTAIGHGVIAMSDGDVRLRMLAGDIVTFTGLQAGSIIPVKYVEILSSTALVYRWNPR